MLYIVGTPIGNLQDLSMRQMETLARVEVILCEDTRSAGQLIRHIEQLGYKVNPNQQLYSYYKKNELQRTAEVLTWLRAGQTVALICESGMPAIADPGQFLIHKVRQDNLPISVVPGPTAFTSAVVLSGLSYKQIMFIGFLPKQDSALHKVIEKIKQTIQLWPDTLFACYESPHRLKKTLELLQQDAQLQTVVVREISKIHESIYDRDRFEEVLAKGEIVILIKVGS